ncbi:MAG: TetR/AcrR family transcriptional regulator [Polyangiaceae bacterium]|nr:TetR/AcrR family transcriptional regulator [Polyangiaceae bacterium]
MLVEAAKIFARFGFKKTSIDDIAKEAGVGKGTVYLAAESKEELFYQVLHREVRAWQASCARVIDPRVPADELLTRLYLEAQKNLMANTLVRDLFRGEMVRMLPKWAGRFDELRALGRGNLMEVLRIGVRQGVFREDLDVETVASVLQDMHLAGWILRPESSTDVEQQRRTVVGFDLILHGLRPR